MAKKTLAVGSEVVCRLFNTPEGKFYGEPWRGVVVAIDESANKPYEVTRPGSPNISLARKEIKQVI